MSGSIAPVDGADPAVDLTAADLTWSDVDVGPVATTALVAAASGRRVPEGIDQVLERCGLAAVSVDTPADALHGALEKLSGRMRDGQWTPTQRALAMSVMAQRFKAAKIPNGSKILRAAFPQDAPGGTSAAASNKTPIAAIVRAAEPWPAPVDGVTVLTSVYTLIIRYVILTPDQARAAALWVLHSYVIDAFEHSPILAVLSPLKRCGKSTLLSVLTASCDRALHAANASTALLFRIIETHKPTLLLDEADCWLNDDKAELRGVVNSGWAQRGALALRCDGDEHEPKTFSTWTPKVLAAIGRLPDTIADRSIVLQLRRKTRAEHVVPLRSRTLERETHDLRRQIRRWANDHCEVLRESNPMLPEVLNDRAADSWQPLLAIAELIGGSWPGQARAAALALSAPSDDDAADESLSVQLLADIRQVFEDQDDPPVLDTATLLSKLAEIPDKPWAEYRHGKPLNAHGLARMLRAFTIMSAGKIRQREKTIRGYRRDAFVDSWNRYVPLSPAGKVEQWNKLNKTGPELPVFEVEQHGPCSTSPSGTNPMNTERCSTVPPRTLEDSPSQHFLTFEDEP